jgi:hypothetical protein
MLLDVWVAYMSFSRRERKREKRVLNGPGFIKFQNLLPVW